MTLRFVLTTTEQIATRRRGRVAAVLGLLLLSFTAHLSALSGWWLSDDPQVLVQAERYAPGEYFFVPEVWRYLSASNFTPLVTLSFEADLALAGLEPRWFYAHQVMALTLAAILLYLLLAPYTGGLLAFFSAALLLVSPQAIVAARTLMVRHYVEGLVFALLALLLWRAGRAKRRDAAFGLLAGLAYLLAILAKEVYLGIPLIMLWESRGAGERWVTILRRILPVVVAGVGYGVWRLLMLGTVGGYGDTASLLELGEGMLRHALGPVPPSLQLIFAAAALVLLALGALNHPKGTLAFCGISLLVVLAPLFAVAGQMEMRHLFAAFAVLSAGLALAVQVSRRGNVLARMAAGVALVTVVTAGQIVRDGHQSGSSRVVAEGRYVWIHAASAPALLATAPAWYLEGLAELRSRRGGGQPPRYLLSREALLIEDIDPRQVVRVSSSNGTRLEPFDAAFVQQIQAEKERFDPGAPLSVLIERDDHRLRWELGPQPSSGWTFLTYPDYDEYRIPPSGTRIIPEPTGRRFFRILRHLPDGGWTVSPPLGLPEPGQSIRWQSPRPGRLSVIGYRESRTATENRQPKTDNR